MSFAAEIADAQIEVLRLTGRVPGFVILTPEAWRRLEAEFHEAAVDADVALQDRKLPEVPSEIWAQIVAIFPGVKLRHVGTVSGVHAFVMGAGSH